MGGKDPLCPLGFHPQVRWPTRCKRCFREFKEHTVANDACLRARSLDPEGRAAFDEPSSRSRTPSLASSPSSSMDDSSRDYSSPYSSISSVALNRLTKYREGETNQKSGMSVVSETLTLPSGDGPLLRRRRTTDLTDIIPDDTTNQSETYTVRLRKTPSFGSSGDESPSPDSPSPSSSPKPRNSPNLKLSLPDDKLPNNERKNDDVQLPEVKPKKKKKRLLIQGVQEVTSLTPPDSNSSNDGESPNEESADVAFIIQENPAPVKRVRILVDIPVSTAPFNSMTWTNSQGEQVELNVLQMEDESLPTPSTSSTQKIKLDSILRAVLFGMMENSGYTGGMSDFWGSDEQKNLTNGWATHVKKSKTDTEKFTPIQIFYKEIKVAMQVVDGLLRVVKMEKVGHEWKFNGWAGRNQKCSLSACISKCSVKSTTKKKKVDDDDETMSMTTATDTTETTLVDLNETVTGGLSSWEVEEMKTEVKRLRDKCDKLEKEKAEILARRVASLDAPRAQSSEYVKLQQKVNQLTSINEDLKDEQKHLETRVRELEVDLSNRPTSDFMQRSIAEMRSKLSQAESQVDQLQEEKRDAIKQMRDMQEEFEEMQDGFREEQAEEFASLKTHHRLLQFKLRKVEKRGEQLEAEKKELEQRLEASSNSIKMTKLEEELKKAKLENERLKSNKDTLGVSGLKKKSPVLTKAPSGESVEPPMPSDFDPHKTLRDLQSALERESDSREQLKFAEEESGTLRQKISRIEDENESLLIQIKKMSAKSRTDLNKGRVETGRLGHPTNSVDNNDKLDASELKLQLELNEQESKILRKKVEDLEKSNSKLVKDLQKAEDRVQKELSSPVTKSKNVDEVSLLRRKIIEKEREIERLQTEMLSVTTKNKGKMINAKSAEETHVRLDAETKAELRKVQDEFLRLKTESEKQRTALESELAKTHQEVDKHQLNLQHMGESNKLLLEQIEGLKRDVRSVKQHYESVQEEFVIKNSQLSSQKEGMESDIEKLRREYDTIDRELRALRETFNNRQDTWIKEKLGLEQKLRDVENSSKKLINMTGDRDATKLKTLLKQQQNDLDTKTRELGDSQERIIQLQKDNEELKRQLDDFDKVAQVQLRSLSTDSSRKSDKDIKSLQEKLTAEEKHHKNEVAQMKLRQDQQLAVKNEEISSVQSQLSRAKRERDTYRQMVDSAQRAISELKSRGSGSKGSVTAMDEASTGAQAAMKALQDRIASLEDDLAEARRDTSHVKTEMVTEKSQWEMQIGEMQQKINELEEEKLLSGSGRIRGSGALSRTRLELAWQKEREEQQRRLKEATTLARDLKTTLLEIERERDRERVDAKRRVEQLKATMEEEQEEIKRKVGESQCDLLELRDAHAKLRTANEKLRKDREKLETARELQIKKELESRKVRLEREKMLDQLMSRVKLLNPTSSNSNLAQQPPKLSFAEVLHFLQNIKSLTEPEDLTNPREQRRSHFKKASSLGEDSQDLPRSRESLQSMPGGSYGLSDNYGAAGRSQRQYVGSSSSSTLTLPSRARTPGPSMPSSNGSGRGIRSNASDSGGSSSAAMLNPRGSLYRKALSLEQTMSMPDEQKIWKGNSDAGSGSSLASNDDQYSRGSSMERTSIKSDKPKGLVGKMKKFVKSKSIEEQPSNTALKVVRAGVQAAGVGSNAGSDLSINSDAGEKESKGTLKDKMKGMFKRSSRSPSVERKGAPTLLIQPKQGREPTPQRDAREGTPGSSTQRPLMPSAQRPLMPSSTKNVPR